VASRPVFGPTEPGIGHDGQWQHSVRGQVEPQGYVVVRARGHQNAGKGQDAQDHKHTGEEIARRQQVQRPGAQYQGLGEQQGRGDPVGHNKDGAGNRDERFARGKHMRPEEKRREK